MDINNNNKIDIWIINIWIINNKNNMNINNNNKINIPSITDTIMTKL